MLRLILRLNFYKLIDKSTDGRLYMQILQEEKTKLYHGLKLALIVFLAVVVANALFNREGKYEDKQENTIAFSGHGEVTAVPDIASVYFTISKEAKTVKEAQNLVSKIEKKSLDFLKENNILDKDIKTSSSSFYPKYEYQYPDRMPCIDCRPGKNILTGYEVSESITVKVRNTDDVGKIIEGLGTLGVSDLSGPNFSIDNEEGLKADARKKAIDDAKEKAKILAKDLGVRLGKIVSFNESQDYPMPLYGKAMMNESAARDSVAPSLPKGENTISSDVTITYQIR